MFGAQRAALDGRDGLQHLFRWFVGLNLDDPVWDATVFTENRDRFLEAEVGKEFLRRVVAQAREKGWTSD
jgi:transposase